MTRPGLRKVSAFPTGGADEGTPRRLIHQPALTTRRSIRAIQTGALGAVGGGEDAGCWGGRGLREDVVSPLSQVALVTQRR